MARERGAQRVWRALTATWERRGIAGVCDMVRGKLWWHADYVRLQVDLGAWTITPAPAPPIEAREGTLEELRRFRDRTPGLPVQFYEDVLHGARRVYVGFRDGEIGHVSWVFTARDRTPHMRLGPGEIMLDGAYTRPAFRGLGLLSAVERAVLNDAKREGMRFAYTHVALDNHASLRGVAKTGFVPIGLLRWRWVLGIPITMYTPGAVAISGPVPVATIPPAVS